MREGRNKHLILLKAKGKKELRKELRIKTGGVLT
jgi:hypothetical protein